MSAVVIPVCPGEAGCPLLVPPSFLLGPAGVVPQLTACPFSRSKQRHNKLWRQQPADGPAADPSEFLPETLDDALDTRLPCLDDTTQPGLAGSQAPGGPSLPCCFRRLSDPLLLPHHEDAGSLVHLEDLERDALLEDAAQPVEVHKLVQHSQEGARHCEKDVKRKLEFGSPKARGGSLPQAGEVEKKCEQRAGRWRRASTQLDQENLNNNNSKRSCPDDFEVGGDHCGSSHATSTPPHRAPSWPTLQGCSSHFIPRSLFQEETVTTCIACASLVDRPCVRDT